MVTGIIKTENYRTEITAKHHLLIADEPEHLGGGNVGMTPIDLLASALIACTNITLRMYANRKTWSVNQITTTIEVSQEDDKTIFIRVIDIDGQIDDSQKARMLLIANKCPVHKILSSASTINTTLNNHG